MRCFPNPMWENIQRHTLPWNRKLRKLLTGDEIVGKHLRPQETKNSAKHIFNKIRQRKHCLHSLIRNWLRGRTWRKEMFHVVRVVWNHNSYFIKHMEGTNMNLGTNFKVAIINLNTFNTFYTLNLFHIFCLQLRSRCMTN